MKLSVLYNKQNCNKWRIFPKTEQPWTSVCTGMEIKPICHFLQSAWEPCHFLSWSARHYKQSVTFTVYSYETSQPPRFIKIALSESSLFFPLIRGDWREQGQVNSREHLHIPRLRRKPLNKSAVWTMQSMCFWTKRWVEVGFNYLLMRLWVTFGRNSTSNNNLAMQQTIFLNFYLIYRVLK